MGEVARIEGYEAFTPAAVSTDDRGWMAPWFDLEQLADRIGTPVIMREGTCSVSKPGVLRGIHYDPGRAKYVTCLSGSVFDVAVDLRKSSPTYGCWAWHGLDDSAHHAVYLAEGLGHAVLSMEHSVVAYLYTTPYRPEQYQAIYPLDPDLDIQWPTLDPVLSEKDARAPYFAEWGRDG